MGDQTTLDHPLREGLLPTSARPTPFVRGLLYFPTPGERNAHTHKQYMCRSVGFIKESTFIFRGWWWKGLS